MIRRIRKVLHQPAPVLRRGGKKPVAFMGIDPSLRGTGVAVVGSTGDILWSHGWTDKKTLQGAHAEKLSWYKMQDGDDGDRMRRIFVISTWICNQIVWWKRHYDLYLAIEGYAFSQNSQRASDLHELSGAVKMAVCEQANLPFRIYDPLTLKLAWTGSGTADKPLMIMTCFKLFGEDYTPLESAGENLADATLIAQLLRHEALLKLGQEKLEDLAPSLRKVMTRTTKHAKEPIKDRPFIKYGATHTVEPVFGSGANTWWLGSGLSI